MQKLFSFIVFHNSIGGIGAFLWGDKPTKPHVATGLP